MLIADNKIALNAGWDLKILRTELGVLASLDVDIDPPLTGEIDVILKGSDDPDDDVIPAVPVEPRAPLGQGVVGAVVGGGGHRPAWQSAAVTRGAEDGRRCDQDTAQGQVAGLVEREVA